MLGRALTRSRLPGQPLGHVLETPELSRFAGGKLSKTCNFRVPSPSLPQPLKCRCVAGSGWIRGAGPGLSRLRPMRLRFGADPGPLAAESHVDLSSIQGQFSDGHVLGEAEDDRKNQIARMVRQSCFAHVPERYPWRSLRASQVRNSCQNMPQSCGQDATVAETRPRVGPDSARIGRSISAPHRPNLVDVWILL